MTLESIPLPVIVRSGAHVVGDFTAEIASGAISIGEIVTDISGQPVMVSGQPVDVGSGIHVVGDFIVGSGLGVVVQSGIGVIGDFSVEVSRSVQPVTISGQPVVVGAGLNVVGDFSTTVESGLHVVVESGIGVVGDFTTEVASGLYVVQGKTAQLQDYFISDVDESDTGIKFYGYLGADGKWYIMQDTSGTNFRYASSGVYASNWIDRSGIIYQRFDQEF